MKDKTLIKLVLWFIALCITGFVVCVILGMLKIAIQAIVIVAAILMFLILLGWIGYGRIRERIRKRESGDTSDD